MDEYEDARLQDALQKRSWDDALFKHTDQKAEMLMLNKKFTATINDLRTKFVIEIDTIRRQFKPAGPWHYLTHGPSHFPWDDDITLLMQMAKLRPGWRCSINNLVLTGHFIAPPSMLIRPLSPSPYTEHTV
jgi:hypothetical protein